MVCLFVFCVYHLSKKAILRYMSHRRDYCRFYVQGGINALDVVHLQPATVAIDLVDLQIFSSITNDGFYFLFYYLNGLKL